MARKSLKIAGAVIIGIMLIVLAITFFSTSNASWTSTTESQAQIFGDFSHTIIAEAVILGIGILIFFLGIIF